MARHLDFFDYKIVQKSNINIGDLVIIPFKGRTIYGLVKNIKQKSEFTKISNIDKKIISLFDEKDIERLEILAQINYISVPSLLHSIFLKSAKKPIKQNKELGLSSVKKTELDTLTNIIKKNTSAEITFKQQLISTILICKNSLRNQEKTIIITPNHQIKNIIQTTLQNAKIEYQLSLENKSTKDQYKFIKNWQEIASGILIMGKKSLLIPHKELHNIIIIDPESDDYSIVDQNPTINIKFAANLLADQYKANLYQIGHTTSLNIKKSFSQKINPKIIELSSHGEYSEIPLISKTTLILAEKSLQKGKNVILFYNRKGHAKMLKCTECNHIPFCGKCGNIPTVREDDLLCNSCSTEMWTPKTCPACQKESLKNIGIGSKYIEKKIKSYLEKNDLIKYSDKIRVITEKDFRDICHLQIDNIGLITDLLADLHESGYNFDTNERARYKIRRLCHTAIDLNAEYILQTFSKNNLKQKIDTKSKNKELADRKSLNLPPYSGLIKIKKYTDTNLLDELNNNHISFEEYNQVLEISYNNQNYQLLNDILSKYQDINIKQITADYAHTCFTQSKS